MVQRVKGSGRRRVDNTVRQALLKDHRNRFGPGGRWHIPGRVSEYEQAFVAGEPVVIDSSQVMCALLHAGLPSDDYAYGGRYRDRQLMLDVDGRLSEWTAPEDGVAVQS